MYEERFLRRAIEISAQAIDTPGTEPFGAVIVKDGQIVGEGINRSVMNHDPTSHGETEAIRDACRSLETVNLRGCELYSSCEPCALCVAAMNIAGITALYYAADMAQAGDAIADLPEAARFPVDVDRLTHECGHAVAERIMPCEQHLDAEATKVLCDWANLARSRA
ncbi:nucleoside deaminase [Celeribacter halophilus]|jgi:tRNA(Arg) A34 adenosine deaminase TadA|uniref:nucleoside deaminase n=1 Tax=Celeribacter halophilus TaxID=576117 RepID=UPI002FD13903